MALRLMNLNLNHDLQPGPVLERGSSVQRQELFPSLTNMEDEDDGRVGLYPYTLYIYRI